ncbi:hypothetical protein OPKNFCMD_6318 [Methylobacterium crusticola]|uniref:Uncharacterized protein n=1 Tax=Methylobacterium crusticola TaxID=1697972 RepID=A0ABQ4R9U0_9HYPH|nr:hypothetical protein [Methylobacterium crusticola]GJD53541.1 hypothetical protein OPKNFCMD_6318 [Methylobacterium crusticola]
MTAAARNARHLSLIRAERAAGQAFGFAEEGAHALARSFGRLAATATGAAVAAAFAATLAWAF